MFKLNEIKELIKLVDQSSVSELDIESDGTRLSIRKPGKTEIVQVQPAYAPLTNQAPQAMLNAQTAAVGVPAETPAAQADAAAKAADHANLHKIVSPMVGTFYRASSPDASPFVNVGDRVDQKSTVCIIEAMKLMNELEAEVNGEIVEVLVENGQLIEYGQPLFLVKPI